MGLDFFQFHFPKRTLSYNKYVKAFRYGTVHRSTKKDRGRRYLIYKRLCFPYARVLWNLANPDDMARPDESVHHKDDDRTNDSLDNLEKMNARRHQKLHLNKEAPAVKAYRKFKAEIARVKHESFSRIPRTFNGWFNQRALTWSKR